MVSSKDGGVPCIFCGFCRNRPLCVQVLWGSNMHRCRCGRSLGVQGVRGACHSVDVCPPHASCKMAWVWDRADAPQCVFTCTYFVHHRVHCFSQCVLSNKSGHCLRMVPGVHCDFPFDVTVCAFVRARVIDACVRCVSVRTRTPCNNRGTVVWRTGDAGYQTSDDGQHCVPRTTAMPMSP